MSYVNIVTVLALFQFILFGIRVGGARQRYGVKAPAITGNETFERHFRVQMNTLEQLVVFVPAMYLFSHYFNPLYAAVLGVVYLVGRTLYAVSYVRDPAKRGPGFGLTMLPTLFMLIGALVGAIRGLV